MDYALTVLHNLQFTRACAFAVFLSVFWQRPPTAGISFLLRSRTDPVPQPQQLSTDLPTKSQKISSCKLSLVTSRHRPCRENSLQQLLYCCVSGPLLGLRREHHFKQFLYCYVRDCCGDYIAVAFFRKPLLSNGCCIAFYFAVTAKKQTYMSQY
jgi:hypothetical protein